MKSDCKRPFRILWPCYNDSIVLKSNFWIALELISRWACHDEVVKMQEIVGSVTCRDSFSPNDKFAKAKLTYQHWESCDREYFRWRKPYAGLLKHVLALLWTQHIAFACPEWLPNVSIPCLSQIDLLAFLLSIYQFQARGILANRTTQYQHHVVREEPDQSRSVCQLYRRFLL